MQISIPGRICLFGEHSDWAGGYRRINSDLERGYCLITGTNQGILADVRPHPTHLVITADVGRGERIGPYEIPIDPQALLTEAQEGGLFAYAAGVAHQMLIHHHVQGLVIDNTHTDLPVRKGLSSSAAISVLTARAFNRVYDLKLTVRGEMEIAYRGELTTPSRCGRMDQGCAFGHRPVLMTFDGDLMDVLPVPVGGEFAMLIVDLKKGKNTQKILADLNRCYPFAASALDRTVHEYLGPINRRIVGEAVKALAAGDARLLGRLMCEAQALFDRHLAPACPDELAAPRLHEVLAYGPIQGLIWGGKGVGSQGDGCAQLVARDAAARDRCAEVLERDLGLACLPLDIARPKRIRKAVIPVAGFGTRMFPASKAVKKELAPLVDADGFAKPIIQVVVEEALASGIEEIGLVVQPEDRAVFEAFFSVPLDPGHLNRLPTRQREQAAWLESLGRLITYIPQETEEGFGHAVLCARDWVGDEPFLLMLGDHVYRAGGNEPCAAQLIAAAERSGTSVLGLGRRPPEEVSHFGTVAGAWTGTPGVLEVTEFAEKPALDYAQSRLRVVGVGDGFLCVFGLYALRPSIFTHLARLVETNMRTDGEVQLTPALEMMRQEEGCLGLVIDGVAYDTGRPEQYLDTLQAFARRPMPRSAEPGPTVTP